MNNLLRLRFASRKIHSSYREEKYQECSIHVATYNQIITLTVLFYLINQVVWYVTGSLSLEGFAIKITLIASLAIINSITTISKHFQAKLSAMFKQQREFLIYLPVFVVITAVSIFTLKDDLKLSLNIQVDLSALEDFFKATEIHFDFLWIYMMFGSVLLEWYSKIFFFSFFWTAFLIFALIYKLKSPAAMLLLFRTLICMVLAILYHERRNREIFTKKYRAKENLSSFQNILKQIREDIIIINQKSEIKFCNMPELEHRRNSDSSPTLNDLTLVSPGLRLIQKIEIQNEEQMRIEFPLCTESTQKATSLNALVAMLSGEKELYAELEKGNVFTINGTIFDDEGNESRWIEIRISTGRFDEEHCLIVLLRDISDSVSQLKQINQSQMNLLSWISHELRTPMNTNVNLLENACERGEVSEHLKKAVILPALQNAKLLSHFIEDVIDFVQMQRGSFHPAVVQANLTEIVLECVEFVKSSIIRREVSIELLFNPRKEIFHATDAEKYKRIVLNLLLNAAKHTFEGTIQVDLYINPQKEATFTIIDTGIGIKSSELDEIRRNLNKKAFHYSKKLGDPGMGLTISHALITRLNPRTSRGLVVDSNDGKGSVFSFSIEELNVSPSSSPESRRKMRVHGLRSSIELDLISNTSNNGEDVHETVVEIQRPAVLDVMRSSLHESPVLMHQQNDSMNCLMSNSMIESPELTKKQKCNCAPVLVVDDNNFNLITMETLLKSLDVKVATASNGLQAVQKIEERRLNPCGLNCRDFVLVFMDLDMPVMDGYEATQTIRAKYIDDDLANLMIIGCTANEAREKLDRCLEVGMDSYLKKPVDKAKLREVLARIKTLWYNS